LVIEIYQTFGSEQMAAADRVVEKLQIRSLILCLCLSDRRRRRWKEGKSANCWRSFTGL